MSPARAPDVVRGDVPGLLCRGMPLRWRDEDTRFVATGAVFFDADDGPWAIATPCEGLPLGTQDHPSNFDVDWSDRAAIYLCLAWLADRGHVCAWMLPTTHGGRVEAWDGLSAWEVSAIVVARSVGRVARGLGPVVAILSDWTPYQSVYDRNWLIPSVKRISVNYARYYPDSEARFGGWSVCLPAIGPKHYTGGPETGDAGKLAADRAALADGCVLQVPGGLILPDLGADHE